MMPDSSKYYVANFLDSSINVIDIHATPGSMPTAALNATTPRIDLLGLAAGNYNPFAIDLVGGAGTTVTVNGFVGALPIQTPVSPDGKWMITANTLTANVLVTDTKTDKVVASLACDAGCHGVAFGAKKGGGYYAYVSSKFSNRMIVVDPNHGNDAFIVGSVLLTATGATAMDGTIPGNSPYAGMGGQGVLPIPLVYNGWVQKLPEEWKEKLTKSQLNPFPTH
jgi:DNA-binding beta-propeller fold protein YncE